MTMKKYFHLGLLVILFLMSTRSFSQQPYTLSVRVNYSDAVQLYHDEPVVLTVAVSNKEAEEIFRLNHAALRRIKELDELLEKKQINRQDYDKEKKQLTEDQRPIQKLTLGKSTKPWHSLLNWKLINASGGNEQPVQVVLMVNPQSDAIATLDENGVNLAYFGITPAELKKIPAGKYFVTASLEGQTSERISMELKNEMMPPAVAESADMLLKEGQFYWHINDVSNAMGYADKILQQDPRSLEGFSLKGDIQLLDKAYEPALESYNKALLEFYRQNKGISEEPEYLLGTISWIKKQLGR